MEYSPWSSKFLLLLKKTMLIGTVSQKTELSRDTIRFYEKRGLIKPKPSNSQFNNYKIYDNQVLQRLMLIKKAKSFGFSLNEIAELLDLVDFNQASCKVFEEKIKKKIADIDQKITELKDMKKLILHSAQSAKNACESITDDSNCQILQLN